MWKSNFTNLSSTLFGIICVPKCTYIALHCIIYIYNTVLNAVPQFCIAHNVISKRAFFGLFQISVVLEGIEILYIGQAVISVGELIQVAQAGLTRVCREPNKANYTIQCFLKLPCSSASQASKHFLLCSPLQTTSLAKIYYLLLCQQ